MSSFDRTYRPVDFDSYIGNEISKQKMKNMLKRGEVPHTIIFQGDRGCGKTTLARIVGKSLLCKNPKPDGTSCEECSNCIKINEKFIIDGGRASGIPIQEVDVNAEGKKDNVLNLIQEMRTKPAGNSKKIYILDEVQSMPPKAQSSLLKICEEPSPWLYIFLCTTDPEDLIVPLRSRMVPFYIKRPTIKDISGRLEVICQNENIKYDPKALNLIAKVSNRIPRESIKNLETISSSGDITYEAVERDLQIVRLDTYTDYIKIFNREVFDALDFINNLHDKYGVEIPDFMDGLAEFIIDAFNIKMGVSLEKYTEEEARNMRRVFKEMDTKMMIKFLTLIEQALKLKDNPRYALVMLTLKMGFPQYFVENFDKKEVVQELSKEQAEGIKNYKKIKDEHNRSIIQPDQEITDDLISSLFEDSYIVE